MTKGETMTRKRLNTIRAILRRCVAYMLWGDGVPPGLTLKAA